MSTKHVPGATIPPPRLAAATRARIAALGTRGAGRELGVHRNTVARIATYRPVDRASLLQVADRLGLELDRLRNELGVDPGEPFDADLSRALEALDVADAQLRDARGENL